MGKLTIVGGVALDVILPNIRTLPNWPDHLEFTPHNLVLFRDSPILTIGGNGGNSAFVASRCGAEVTLHTALGRDPHGALVRGWLEKAGCRVVTGAHQSTPLNVTAANKHQQRATFFHPGKALHMPARGLARNKYLLVCGWPHPPLDEMARGLAEAKGKGVFTALDAGPLLGGLWSQSALRRLLAGLDLFIANEHEFQKLFRTTDFAAAFHGLRQHFPGHVVVKRGRSGALWLPAGGDRAMAIAAPRVRVVNTVGAGDSFNGALLAGLADGGEFSRALRAACRVASRVVGSSRGVLGLVRRS